MEYQLIVNLVTVMNDQTWIQKRFIILLGFLLILASCSGGIHSSSLATQLPSTTITTTLLADDEPAEGNAVAAEDEPVGSTTLEPLSAENTPAITATATPDLRLNPEDWKNWPIVPVISENAKSIYLRGLQSGNNPKAFSKAGDCQSIKEVLMGVYDLPGRYTIPAEDAFLKETIEQFQGSFNRDGYAVKGGFNAATVLSPIWADPEACLPGENPLACEIRVHHPSMILISLEVWWDGRTPDRYEQYMRNIIEYSIDQGVLPILSTKADNVEGDHSINYTSAKLAYEYDIPLWNFWLAAQPLANHGIDPARDGFHISVAAWNVRSYTALETVDAVWRAVNTEEAISPDLDENQVEEQEPEDLEQVISIPDYSKTTSWDGGQTGNVIFELDVNYQNEILPAGIYQLGFENGSLKRIIDPGTSLFDIRTDKLLVGDDQLLMVTDMQGTIVSEFNAAGVMNAFWVDDEMIVYAEENLNQALEVWLFDPETEQATQLLESAYIEKLIKGAGEVFYFEGKLDCENSSNCDELKVFQFNIKTGAILDFGTVLEFSPSPKGDLVSYQLQKDGYDNLFIQTVNQSGIAQYISLVGNLQLEQAWAPMTNEYAAIRMYRSDYFGKANELLHYVVNLDTLVVREFTAMSGLNPQLVWSPDEKYLLTSATSVLTDEETDQATYQLVMRILDVSNGKIHNIHESFEINSENAILIEQIIWNE